MDWSTSGFVIFAQAAPSKPADPPNTTPNPLSTLLVIAVVAAAFFGLEGVCWFRRRLRNRPED